MSPFLYNYIATFMPNRFIRFINRVLPNRRVIEALYITGISIYSRRRYFFFCFFFATIVAVLHIWSESPALIIDGRGKKGGRKHVPRSHYHCSATRCAFVRSLTICYTLGLLTLSLSASIRNRLATIASFTICVSRETIGIDGQPQDG